MVHVDEGIITRLGVGTSSEPGQSPAWSLTPLEPPSPGEKVRRDRVIHQPPMQRKGRREATWVLPDSACTLGV